jgi:hypothetical protein
MVVEVLMDTRWIVNPELPDRYRSITPCPCSSKVEHRADNSKTVDRYHSRVPINGAVAEWSNAQVCKT